MKSLDRWERDEITRPMGEGFELKSDEGKDVQILQWGRDQSQLPFHQTLSPWRHRTGGLLKN